MILARVVGTVVATRKDPRLEGQKLLIEAAQNYRSNKDTIDALRQPLFDKFVP